MKSPTLNLFCSLCLWAIFISPVQGVESGATEQDLKQFASFLPEGTYTGINPFAHGDPRSCIVKVSRDSTSYTVEASPPYSSHGIAQAIFSVRLGDPLFCQRREESIVCNVRFHEPFLLYKLVVVMDSSVPTRVSVSFNGKDGNSADAVCNLIPPKR